MHDFIQHLSFPPFPAESRRGSNTAGAAPGRQTKAATREPLRRVLRSVTDTRARLFARARAEVGGNRKSRIEN
jgi:hypothetical protein